MKRTWLLWGLGACAMALALWFVFSGRLAIRHHTRGWNKAMRNIANSEPLPWVQQWLASPEMPRVYWYEAARHHEKALLKLGYLTNCEFRLTNQVITREFSSNFFRLIHQRLGTNTDQVWMCPWLTNRDGIAPTLPVKDHATWEQTFRECAARYASNLPTAMPLTP